MEGSAWWLYIWFKKNQISFYKYIIIIMSCNLHGFPWPSLATSLYRPSLPPGLLDYILYKYRAVLVLDGHPTLARLCEGVYRSTSLMNLSLLLIKLRLKYIIVHVYNIVYAHPCVDMEIGV